MSMVIDSNKGYKVNNKNYIQIKFTDMSCSAIFIAELAYVQLVLNL